MNKDSTNLRSPRNNNDEINLFFILNFLIRNKSLISLTSFIIFLVFSIYGFSRKKIWEGQFDIVLETESSNIQSGMVATNQQKLAKNLGVNLSSSSNTLDTQVGILESPSVLMPIFNYVKSVKKDKLLFSSWKEENLNVKLKKNTSILKIKFKDENKDLIIPVLTKISNAYQEYSSKKRKRKLNIQKEFLADQILVYKEKTKDSVKKAQDFAFKENLLLNNNLILNSLIDGSSPTRASQFGEDNIGTNNFWFNQLNSLNIENIRVRAANKIKNIDLQIKKIEDLANDSKEKEFVSMNIYGLTNKNNDLNKSLLEIEMQLINFKTRYKDNDSSIVLLKEKREMLINLLKEKTIEFLKAEKLTTEALMEAATRPSHILTKYQRLLRDAAMDEKTLTKIQDQLRIITISEAQFIEPWKLITKPTIIDKGTFNEKFTISLFGLILGTFMGLVLSLYKESKSNLIYEDEQLESIFNSKILEKIILTDNYFFINTREIFINEILNSYQDKKLVFIKSQEINDNEIKKFSNLIFNDENYIDIKPTFENIKNDQKIILFTAVQKITYQEAIKIKRRLELYNNKIEGIIIIE